jgi:hypothetical protein
MKLPFGFEIRRKVTEVQPKVVVVKRYEPEPQPMSKYEFEKLYPKSWKQGIWQQKPWKAQGISWSDWRCRQARLACDFYAQNDCTRQSVADKFGISINAFDQAWKAYKRVNLIA